MMRHGCRGRGLGLSGAIAALVLGVALLAFAVAPSRPLAGSHRTASLRAPASGSSQSLGVRYDSVTGARAWNANTYVSGPTNPFGAVTSDNEQMSLYATC